MLARRDLPRLRARLERHEPLRLGNGPERVCGVDLDAPDAIRGRAAPVEVEPTVVVGEVVRVPEPGRVAVEVPVLPLRQLQGTEVGERALGRVGLEDVAGAADEEELAAVFADRRRVADLVLAALGAAEAERDVRPGRAHVRRLVAEVARGVEVPDALLADDRGVGEFAELDGAPVRRQPGLGLARRLGTVRESAAEQTHGIVLDRDRVAERAHLGVRGGRNHGGKDGGKGGSRSHAPYFTILHQQLASHRLSGERGFGLVAGDFVAFRA